MTLDIDEDVAAALITACDQYPYHELVAYSQGHTIKELQDWLSRGAVSSLPNLREFTRRYCQKDAEYARRIFGVIQTNCEEGSKANLGPLWKWFDTRWPCKNPLAVATLLAGSEVEDLSLEESFRDPNQEVRQALRVTRWFHADELDNPSTELNAELEARGYRRESGARPEPSPTPEG